MLADAPETLAASDVVACHTALRGVLQVRPPLHAGTAGHARPLTPCLGVDVDAARIWLIGTRAAER